MKSIVLTSTQYRDDSYMLNLFTESAEVVSVSVSVRGRSSKVKRGYLMPLTLLDVEFRGKENAKVRYLSDCRVYRVNSDLTLNPMKMLVSQFLAEMIWRTFRFGGGDGRVFDFIEKSIIEFDELREGVQDWHLLFLIRMMHYIGIMPDLSDYSDGCVIDVSEGKAVRYGFGEVLDSEMTGCLVKMMRDVDFRLSGRERSRMVDFIVRYYQVHLEGFGEAKSLEVLRSLAR